MDIYRVLEKDLVEGLKRKSSFLFGPRQVGKSTLIRSQFPQAFKINLLSAKIRRTLLENPDSLMDLVPPNCPFVIIDEIQKVPEILDVVQLMIDEKGTRFLLTGSSSRKLKKQGINLLGGRAQARALFPFIKSELGADFNLELALSVGCLPPIYLSDSPHEDLQNYVSEYLIQEISAEGITRNIPAFSRFLEVATIQNGQIINYNAFASDAEVKRTTLQNYYQILADTLLSFRLPRWSKKLSTKGKNYDKIYFFDCGVVNSILGRDNLSLKTPASGPLFEIYIFHELRSWAEYNKKKIDLTYWQDDHNLEVDFYINETIAIEVKCKSKLSDNDLKGLKAMAQNKISDSSFCLTIGTETFYKEGITIMPYSDFIDLL